MKAILRIATKDQYCFIEAEVEGTPDEIVEHYGDLYQAYWGRKVGVGLEKKEFDEIFDDYCWNNGGMAPDSYAKMNAEQQAVIQTIKRSKNREKYKARKSELDEVERIKNITN